MAMNKQLRIELNAIDWDIKFIKEGRIAKDILEDYDMIKKNEENLQK